MSSYIPTKVDLTPRRHHGYSVVLFVFGTLFPPLAVAARFGVGKDFWLNLLLTLAGYIPGHVHNFYIQNVRNNKNHTRTPKWIQRYGLVDISEIRRKERKSQWATRYHDRLPRSTLEGQPYEEGQERGSSTNLSVESGSGGRPKRQPNGELWRPEDESYYNPDKPGSVASSSGGRWHYPANFEDVEPLPSSGSKRSKKKDKKDRWERTQDAYSMPADDGSHRKKKKKKSRTADANSVTTRDSTDFPEDPEGGLYGPDRVTVPTGSGPMRSTAADETVFNHEF